MAIVSIDRGGVAWWCITPSEQPTWRMFWDKSTPEIFVMDLFESDQEDWTLEENGVFEGATRQSCIDKIEELGLYFDPEVER